MKILMVLTSHDELGDTGDKTGFWLEEFAAPYYVLKDAGHDITLASPAGGKPPLDPCHLGEGIGIQGAVGQHMDARAHTPMQFELEDHQKTQPPLNPEPGSPDVLHQSKP